MAISRRTGRSRLTLALLVATSLVILTLDFRDTAVVDRARGAVGGALAPVQGAAESALRPIGNAWNGITGYGDLRAENEALRAQLDELEGAAALEDAAVRQLGDLLRLVEIPWVQDIDRVTARVVAGPQSNFVRTVDIDKGSSSGIREGMPVVTGSGLLGKVVRVTSNRATVQTITDPELTVGVRLVRTEALGSATGTGRHGELRVDANIPADQSVPGNQTVTTSGADWAAFPPDIPVGLVVDTEPSGNALSLDVVVRPFVDTTNLSYVSVLRWEPQL